jgi:hypothetical protein
MSEDDMKDEYDFTHAEVGKFYRPGAKLRYPIYLDDDLQAFLSAAAEREGIPLQHLTETP